MIGLWKQFGFILEKKQKIKVGVLICMMVTGAFLETLGVGLIPMVMAAMMGNENLLDNRYIGIVSETLHLQTKEEILIFLIGVLIFLYLFKGTYLLFMYHIQYRFVYNSRYYTQKKLMKIYLNQPYEYFLQASSGEIVNQLTTDVARTFDLLTAILSFMSEAIIVGILLLAVIFLNPVIAFIIAVTLSILMLLITYFIKPVMQQSGEECQKGTILSNKWILQSISGIKEVKAGKKEQFFLDNYSKYGKMATEAQRKFSLLTNIPRLAIETIFMCVILLILVFMLAGGRNIVNLMPQLAAFAAAAIKILPGVNRMSNYRNQMGYYEPMLNKTVKLIQEAEVFCNDSFFMLKVNRQKKPLTVLKNNCMIEHVTFTYPDGDESVLEDVSMEIPAGKSVGIIGSSGAGKSTVVDILLGLLRPQFGKVLSDDRDVSEHIDEWLENIGYIPQMIYMLDDTIKRNVAFGCSDEEIEEEKVWKALEEAELDEFVKRLPKGLDTSIGERGIRLSGGQRQRIGIARALYKNPSILIFDEATSALDNQTESDIIKSMDSLHGKKTMVIIAHRLTTIANCDMVYKVENRKIIRER